CMGDVRCLFLSDLCLIEGSFIICAWVALIHYPSRKNGDAPLGLIAQC
ncbi:hypothetical protein H5410_035966, partial [Solanum commersonii]